MKANDKTRISAAEMRFMRTTAKYIWSNYIRTDGILKYLKTEPVMGKILKYKNSWIPHVNRMQRLSIPKPLKKLQSAGEKKQRTNNEETLGRRGRNGLFNSPNP
jgi:hypothetical protein